MPFTINISDLEGVHKNEPIRKVIEIDRREIFHKPRANVSILQYKVQEAVWEKLATQSYLDEEPSQAEAVVDGLIESGQQVLFPFMLNIDPKLYDPENLTDLQRQEIFGVYLGYTHSYRERNHWEKEEDKYYFWYPNNSQVRIRTYSTYKSYYPGGRKDREYSNNLVDQNQVSLPERIRSHYESIS